MKFKFDSNQQYQRNATDTVHGSFGRHEAVQFLVAIKEALEYPGRVLLGL